jgi:alpha-galactosidase-like protein
VAKVTITVTATSSSGATIQVSNGGGGTTCTPVSPVVSMTPSQSLFVAPATLVTYNLSVTDKDGAGCAAASFDLVAKGPSGWKLTLGAAKLSLNPGASASTTLQVTSPAVMADGFYTISLDASNSANAALKGTASVTYVVQNPVAPPPPPPPPPPSGTGSFADNFNRPNSATLGNGWTQVLGTFTVTGNEARNTAGKNLQHLAVQSGLIGKTQKVSADFASVDNNYGPSFCLLLRYQDSKNYYKVFRSTGGSSYLGISRVVNGVEKVIKWVGLPNPRKGDLFHLEGRVSGTTLTLSFNGVDKVVVTDGSFAQGAVGMMINRGMASQRADNFSATVQ